MPTPQSLECPIANGRKVIVPTSSRHVPIMHDANPSQTPKKRHRVVNPRQGLEMPLPCSRVD